MLRKQSFLSLKRFFPQFAGVSLRHNQTAPLYDTLDAPFRGETRTERLSNTKSVEPTRNQSPIDSLLQPKVKALLVDAAGTLLSPSEPAAEVRILKSNYPLPTSTAAAAGILTSYTAIL